MTKFPPVTGGGETHIELIAKQMSMRGHTIDIITSPHPKRGARQAYAVHEVVGFSDHGIDFSAVAKIANLLEVSHYDIVHIVNYESLFTFSFAEPCSFTAKRIFSTYNTPMTGSRIFDGIGSFELEKRDVQRTLRALRIDCFIANSKAFLEGYADLGIPPGETVLVPFGIDLTAFTPSLLDKSPDEIRLLCTSRFIGRKGLEYLIKSLDNLPAHYRLYLTGSGSTHDPLTHKQLLELAKQYGDRVVLSAHINGLDELINLYRSADIFVMPSKFEGFGLAALEAMACGTPVVATAVQGLQEFVEHEKTGLLVEYGSSKQLAVAIQRLATDNSLRDALVKNGLQLVKARYDAQRMIDDYEKVYRGSL